MLLHYAHTLPHLGSRYHGLPVYLSMQAESDREGTAHPMLDVELPLSSDGEAFEPTARMPPIKRRRQWSVESDRALLIVYLTWRLEYGFFPGVPWTSLQVGCTPIDTNTL